MQVGGQVAPVTPALARLAGQLDRNDAIAVPAAYTLGESGAGGEAAALASGIQGKGSAALKVVCAESLGMILGRSGNVEGAMFDALLAVASDAKADMKLRGAVVTALGKAKLSPGDQLKLVQALQTVAIAKSGDSSEG